MEMIQQLQRVLHKRTMERIEKEAEVIAKTIAPIWLMAEKTENELNNQYSCLGICFHLNGGGRAFASPRLTVDTEHPYYQHVLAQVTTEFERELDEYHKVTDGLAGVIVESEHPQAESEESES